MVDYKEKLLKLLAEAYRKSKKNAGEGIISRRTQIDPVKLYGRYRSNNGDVEEIEAVNQSARALKDKGFITYALNGFSNEIKKIYLVDEKIEEVESYLSSHYGYESVRQKCERTIALIDKYAGRSYAADKECERLKASLEKNRFPQDFFYTEQLLKGLVFIENNKEPLYLREASMLIYGSSKYLEENTLEHICRILRSALKRPCGPDELLDEILVDFYITKEKQKLYIKGPAQIKIKDTIMNLACFKDGIEFSSDEIKSIEKITINACCFMTVENLSSYYRCFKEDTAYFYLGGYAGRYQRDFLQMVYRDNPDISYLHFGDIDAGGFYIFQRLKQVTSIPFSMYKMFVAELKDDRYSSCLQPLTENDKKRLESLAKEPEFATTAAYMLQNNVKLEQEIISYYDMSPMAI